jgi:hypothetical protein
MLHEADCVRLGLPILARQLFYKRLALALMVPCVCVARVPQQERNVQPTRGVHCPEGHPDRPQNCVVYKA